jgi:hypothetical protein
MRSMMWVPNPTPLVRCGPVDADPSPSGLAAPRDQTLPRGLQVAEVEGL